MNLFPETNSMEKTTWGVAVTGQWLSGNSPWHVFPDFTGERHWLRRMREVGGMCRGRRWK